MKNAVEFTTFAHMIRGRYLTDGMHPLLQLLLLASLSMIFIFCFTMLGMYLVRPFFGITTIDVVMQNAISNPDAVAMNIKQVNALKFLQFMSSIGGFLVPALFFAWLKFPDGDFLMLKRHTRFSLLFLAIFILPLITPFISYIYELNQRLDLPPSMDAFEQVMKDSENAAQKLTTLFLRMPMPVDLIINIIVMALIPAISEELLFRGCIQQVMGEWLKNAHIAIWITAFLFSFIHFEFYGFLPRLVLGGLLGYLFYWSGSLWVPIIAHSLNNGFQIVLAYLHDHGMIQFNILSDESVPLYAVFISIIVASGAMYLFKRISDQRKFIY